MLTVRAIVKKVGVERISEVCKIHTRTVRNWYENNGVPSRHQETVAKLAGIDVSMVASALPDKEALTVYAFGDTAREIVREFDLSENMRIAISSVVERELAAAYKLGVARGKNHE